MAQSAASEAVSSSKAVGAVGAETTAGGVAVESERKSGRGSRGIIMMRS